MVSYIEQNNIMDDFFYKRTLIDTPTRLINHSNEFLPQKKKISKNKLTDNILNNITTYK